MNWIRLTTIVTAVLSLVACKSGSVRTEGGHEDSVVAVANGVAQIKADGITVWGIQDRACEQALDLFRGYNDALLDSLAANGTNSFRSAFNVFVVESGANTILFDAGIGEQGGGTMVKTLTDNGLMPNHICLTHLHFDHIGGLLDGEGKAVFPDAILHVAQLEYDAWATDERWQRVLSAYDGKVQTFEPGTTLFDGVVSTIPAYGHTPGHTVYQVATCLIAGDILHAQDLQLEHPNICSRFDAEPLAAIEMRRLLFDHIRQNGLYLCGAHCYERFITL